MDHNIILIIVAVISLLVGGIVTSTLLKNSVLRKSKGLLQEARDKSEVIKKEKNTSGQGKIPAIKKWARKNHQWKESASSEEWKPYSAKGINLIKKDRGNQ